MRGFLVLNQSILEAELFPTFVADTLLLGVDGLYVLVAAASPGEGGSAALAGVHLPQVDGLLVLDQAAPGGVEPAADAARVLDVLVPGLLVPPHLVLPARLEVTQVTLVLFAEMAGLEMFGEVPLIEGLEPAHLAGVADPLGDPRRLLKILLGLLLDSRLDFHTVFCCSGRITDISWSASFLNPLLDTRMKIIIRIFRFQFAGAGGAGESANGL